MNDMIIEPEHVGQRLDVVLSTHFNDFSRNDLQKHITEGRVRIDDTVITEKKWKIKASQSLISIDLQPVRSLTSPAQPIPLSIVYEDDVIMVIDKPPGLIVHPGAGVQQGTLMNALLHHHEGAKALPRAGLIHRLDKDTSGLLLIAKTLPAYHKLVRMMQKRHIKRLYWAIAHHHMKTSRSVDAPIGRHTKHRQRMCIHPSGKPARTHFKPLQLLNNATWIQCQLETGRTHQIRVHLSSIQHSIIGDVTYPSKHTRIIPFKRQALHAYSLSFPHPVSGEELSLNSPMPDDMAALLKDLTPDVS